VRVIVLDSHGIDVALGGKNIWEEIMKAHVVALTAAIVARGTGAAYTASATVNITAIDAAAWSSNSEPNVLSD
jgi:hypothetical protein